MSYTKELILCHIADFLTFSCLSFILSVYLFFWLLISLFDNYFAPMNRSSLFLLKKTSSSYFFEKHIYQNNSKLRKSIHFLHCRLPVIQLNIACKHRIIWIECWHIKLIANCTCMTLIIITIKNTYRNC